MPSFILCVVLPTILHTIFYTVLHTVASLYFIAAYSLFCPPFRSHLVHRPILLTVPAGREPVVEELGNGNDWEALAALGAKMREGTSLVNNEGWTQDCR